MKKATFVFMLFYILTSSLPLHAQWARTYGGNDYDGAQSIQQTIDGGYIVAGTTFSFGTGWDDILVLKLSPSGDIEWQRTYGGGGGDQASSIQQTVDGGYVLVGHTSSYGAGSKDIWILKLTSTGDIEWQRTYGGSLDDQASSIQQTVDGGYVVAGYTRSFGPDILEILVLKLSSEGRIEWQRTYGDGGASSIQQTSDGGYIVTGSTSSFGPGRYAAWVLKLSPDGDIEWQRTYGGEGDDFAFSIQQTSDGGYIVAGRTSSFGVQNQDLWVLKLSPGGDIEWQRAYDEGVSDFALSISQTIDDGYVVAGYTCLLFKPDDIWILKLTSTGDIEWQRTYGGMGDDECSSIQQTIDGGYIVAAHTYSFGAGRSDFWILKLSSNGDIDPSCGFIRESNANVLHTDSLSQDATIAPQDTYITSLETTVSPQDTDATSTLICSAPTPENLPPVADAGEDRSIFSGELIFFDGSNSYDPDEESIVSYYWDFGDGEASEGKVVSHRYRGAPNQSKDYTVTLIVEDNKEATATDTAIIVVSPLEKQVWLEVAQMMISYNWVGGINEEDIYIISKITASTFFPTLVVTQFSITSGDVIIWLDVWLLSSLRIETYTSPFTPSNKWWKLEFGSQFGVSPPITTLAYPDGIFEGIKVRASDKMKVQTRGLGPPGVDLMPRPNVETGSTAFDPSAAVEIITLITPLEKAWKWIIGKLFSPGELRVYDSQERITGLVNGEVIEEIPYSAYKEDMFLVLLPSDLLLYEVEGTDEGSYGLGLATSVNEDITTFIATDIPISINEVHEYAIDWDTLSQGEDGATVRMDSDGDGTFEVTINTANTFSFIDVVMDFDPDTVELKSAGKWGTCYIELPEGYDVNNIDLSTIKLKKGEDILTDVATSSPSEVGDYDYDNIPDLKVKFDRGTIIQYLIDHNLTSGDITLAVVGQVDNKIFAGTNIIRIIE